MLRRQQLLLLAEAADTLTQLRELAIATSTPCPAERIDVMPGVATLIVTGKVGLQNGFYALELIPQTSPEGVGESKSPG
jgi:hypothetical protein